MFLFFFYVIMLICIEKKHICIQKVLPSSVPVGSQIEVEQSYYHNWTTQPPTPGMLLPLTPGSWKELFWNYMFASIQAKPATYHRQPVLSQLFLWGFVSLKKRIMSEGFWFFTLKMIKPASRNCNFSLRGFQPRIQAGQKHKSSTSRPTDQK